MNTQTTKEMLALLALCRRAQTKNDLEQLTRTLTVWYTKNNGG